MSKTGREVLSTRRPNMTIEFKHEWEKGKAFQYRATIGYKSDGSIGEIFLNGMKHGTAADANARDAAVCVSIAFQHGVPFDVLRHAMARDEEGYPASPIGMTLDEIARQGLVNIRKPRKEGD